MYSSDSAVLGILNRVDHSITSKQQTVDGSCEYRMLLTMPVPRLAILHNMFRRAQGTLVNEVALSLKGNICDRLGIGGSKKLDLHSSQHAGISSRLLESRVSPSVIR